jgi:hypothetical protein
LENEKQKYRVSLLLSKMNEIESAMERWHLARDNDGETLEEITSILFSIGRLAFFNREKGKANSVLADVSGSVLEQIRQAFADYYKSEGCSCCRNESKHDEAKKRLAELLKPDMYEDGSGYNWYLYASTDS